MSPGIPLFGPAPAQPAAGFGARDLLRLVFKYRITIAACLLLVSAVTIFAALRQPREFVASAQLRIRTEQQGTPSFLSGVAAYRETTVQDTPNRRIETEMADLMNRSSVESVIRELSLRPQDLKRTPLDLVLEPFEPAINRTIDAVGRLLGLAADPTPPDPLADAVKAFERSVAIDAVRSKGAEVTSNVIEVKLTGTDRLRTQQALARLLEQYVQRSASRDLELGRQALKALTVQADEARSKMQKAEDAIVAYALRRPVPAEGATSPAGRATPVAESKMRTDEETLQARLDVLRQTYGEQYLEVKSTRIALERLRARMKTQARDNVRSDANLGVLDRRRAVAESRYVELQRKLDQIDLYLKLGPTEAQAALVTEPPRQAVKASIAGKLIGLAAGPVIGLLLGLVLAGLFEAADRRLQTREAVQASLGLVTLAAIPVVRAGAASSSATLPFAPIGPAAAAAAPSAKGVAA